MRSVAEARDAEIAVSRVELAADRERERRRPHSAQPIAPHSFVPFVL